MDVYAAFLLYKDDRDWRIIKDNGSEVKRKDLALNDNMAEAAKTSILTGVYYKSFADAERVVFNKLTQADKSQIQAVKVSLMNKYNLFKESEVLMYREFK